jgi:hypothetical protein
VLELVEFAWHDCDGEITPSEAQIDDMLLLSEGQIEKLIGAARLAVADWPDLKVAADARRAQPSSPRGRHRVARCASWEFFFVRRRGPAPVSSVPLVRRPPPRRGRKGATRAQCPPPCPGRGGF